MQQGFLAQRPYAGDLIERVDADRLGAPGPVRADGKAVRLIAQALDVIEHRIARLQHEGGLARRHRSARGRHRGPAPWRRPPREDRQAQLVQHRLRRRKLTLAAVDQHKVGPGRTSSGVLRRPLALLLHEPGEAAGKHFSHHAEIVRTNIFRLDVELAVLRLHEAIGPCHDHAAHRVGALNMGVVIDLDALRHLRQPKTRARLPAVSVWEDDSAIFRPRASRAFVTA